MLSSEDVKKIDDVFSFWFDGDQQVNYRTKWFPEGNSEIQFAADNEIQNRFGSYLADAVDRKLDYLENTSRSCVALIVILDQFSRHIYRLKKLPPDATERTATDSLALQLSKRFHSNPITTLTLPMAEYVFSLMPMRHTATVEHLSFILHNLKEKESAESKAMELLNKFRKQTVRRLQHLQDREKVSCLEISVTVVT